MQFIENLKIKRRKNANAIVIVTLFSFVIQFRIKF